MTVEELKTALAEVESTDADVVMHTESGEYPVSGIDCSDDGKTLMVRCDGDARRQMFRISYMITKDHRICKFDTVRRMLESENDVIFDIGEWERKFLSENGVEGEISDKTGSVIMNETSPLPVVDENGEIVRYEVEKDRKHYYNCRIMEIMKEIDEVNDIYVRVWKNGNVA